MDRLDQIVAAAVRQGFAVRQGKDGAWTFDNDDITITQKCTPEDAKSLVRLIHTLRGAGLQFPEPHAERADARQELLNDQLRSVRDELRARRRRTDERHRDVGGLER